LLFHEREYISLEALDSTGEVENSVFMPCSIPLPREMDNNKQARGCKMKASTCHYCNRAPAFKGKTSWKLLNILFSRLDVTIHGSIRACPRVSKIFLAAI